MTKFCIEFSLATPDQLDPGESIAVQSIKGQTLMEIPYSGEGIVGACTTRGMWRYADGKQRFLVSVNTGTVTLYDGHVTTYVQ